MLMVQQVNSCGIASGLRCEYVFLSLQLEAGNVLEH